MSAIDNWADMHRRGDSWVNTDAEQTIVSIFTFLVKFLYIKIVVLVHVKILIMSYYVEHSGGGET